MKRNKIHVLIGIMFLLIHFSAYAQTPESISYQAVVRDSDNKLSTNKNVGVRISILLDNQDPVYVETHAVTTNSNGLMSLQIGKGNLVSGLFASIGWASGTYFVRTEIDPSGGTDYSLSSVTQLMSVPYALHAKTAQTLTGSVSYNDLDDTPSLFEGDYEKLTNRPMGSQTGDILYWEEVAASGDDDQNESGWRYLPRGAFGMVLTVDESGKPAWVNIAQLMSFVADAKYDTLYASAGPNGTITPRGKIAVIEGGLAQFTITPNAGYGIDTVYVDSVAISLTGIDRTQPYSYTFTNVDTTHYIHAVFARKKVNFSIRYEGVQAEDVGVWVNWDSEQGTGMKISDSDEYYTAPGSSFPLTVWLAKRTGMIIKLDNVDITSTLIANNYMYTIAVETDDREVDIIFRKNEKTYAVGDVYPANGSPQGVVVMVGSGGENGVIMHMDEETAVWSVNDEELIGTTDESDGRNNRVAAERLAEYPVFSKSANYGEDWYLPAINELFFILNNYKAINAGLQAIPNAVELNPGGFYWSSTERTQDYAWGVKIGEGKDYFYKPEELRMRVVKQIEFE